MFDPKLSLNFVNPNLENKSKVIKPDESNGNTVDSNKPQDPFTSSKTETNSSSNTIEAWLAQNPSTDNVSGFDLKKIISNPQGEDDQSILVDKMREYVRAPLDGKDLKSLTEEQEQELVQDVFNRANEVGDQIVKDIDSKDLRANMLRILTTDLTVLTNTDFESLPSFKGENDNEKILVKKFGLAYNPSNDDFIDNKISYKDFQGSEDFAARRPGEIGKYNPFVITKSEKVPSDLQSSLKERFPTVDPEYFETIYTVEDPSMGLRGANYPTKGGSRILLINPKNIVQLENDLGFTDPKQIEVTKNGIIENLFVESAKLELKK